MPNRTVPAAATGLPAHRHQRVLRLPLPVPEGASPRATVEAQIELLIDMLDHIEPDPDLEDNGDLEPSLGAYRPGDALDAEQDTGDDEPSLGSFDRMIDQEKSCRTAAGTWFPNEDLELDRSDFEDGGDAEPEETDDDLSDREPSLGSVTVAAEETQAYWAGGNLEDYELTPPIHNRDPRGNRHAARECGLPLTPPEYIMGEIPAPPGSMHPGAVAFCCSGRCLEPEVMDGSIVIAEPVLPKRGELAIV